MMKMSRNLCSTHCYYCDDDTVSVRSENRKISKEESEPFFKEFDGMIVADAECDVCGAQYLAWVDFSSNKQTDYWKNDGTRPFVDLSFRAAFNDEPCPEDCPIWNIENTYKRTIRDAPDNTYGTDESRNRWKKRATAALVEAQEVEDQSQEQFCQKCFETQTLKEKD